MLTAKVCDAVKLAIVVLAILLLLSVLIALLFESCSPKRETYPRHSPTGVLVAAVSVSLPVSRAQAKGKFKGLEDHVFLDPCGRVSAALGRFTRTQVAILGDAVQGSRLAPLSTIEGLIGAGRLSLDVGFAWQADAITGGLAAAVDHCLEHTSDRNEGVVMCAGVAAKLTVVADPHFFTSGPTQYGFSRSTPVIPSTPVAARAWAWGVHSWFTRRSSSGYSLEGCAINILLPSLEFERHFLNAWRDCCEGQARHLLSAVRVACVPQLYESAANTPIQRLAV